MSGHNLGWFAFKDSLFIYQAVQLLLNECVKIVYQLVQIYWGMVGVLIKNSFSFNDASRIFDKDFPKDSAEVSSELS